MAWPDVDPDNDQYGEPNSPDIDRSVADAELTRQTPPEEDKATPSVLQKLQKWGDYEAYGDVVHPSLFIPMKTPLSKAILSEWSLPEEPKHSLTVSSLLQQQHFLHRQIGLIIDLSNHETLYADDLPPFLQYQHVQLVAKVFPDQAQVDQVIDLAEQYWASNPTRHIAIHCAYGFNRTGFVVCSYLVQALGMSVDEALAAFEQARPPGVKHERFVKELHRRFDNQRWGSGHSTVGSDTVGSVGGFSQPRGSHEGSVGSMQSDFKGVAEHLQRQQMPGRRSDVGARPPRSPLSGWSPLKGECRSQTTDDLGPSMPRPIPGAEAVLSATSYGSENESLGMDQRSALAEFQRLNKAKLDKNEDLLTNPSLGYGVSELTAALRQQRPRRAVATLPVVESDSSLHGGASSTPRASDSPGMTSPFAALAHSPQGHDKAVLAESLTPAAESMQQQQSPPHHLQNDAQSAGAATGAHQQPAAMGSEHDEANVTSQLQAQKLDEERHVDDADTQSRETESDLHSHSSSDSRQRFRRRGRSKCIVM